MTLRRPAPSPRLLLAAFALAVLAGCASKRAAEVQPALAAAAASLEAARAAGAPEYAPTQLDAARAKLERAQMLARNGNAREAQLLAQQADLDAQLARAATGAERSQRAVDEVEASLRMLRQEIERTPPPAAVNPPPAR